MSDPNDEILRLLEMPSNSVCVDCAKFKSEFLSVPNAVFICKDCAILHSYYLPHISYVKHVTQSVSAFEQRTIELGGNERFENFLSSYRMDPRGPVDQKYQTLALNFYRDQLKISASGGSFEIEPPTLEQGCVLIGGYNKPLSTFQFFKNEVSQSIGTVMETSDKWLDKVIMKIGGNKKFEDIDNKAADMAKKIGGVISKLGKKKESNNEDA